MLAHLKRPLRTSLIHIQQRRIKFLFSGGDCSSDFICIKHFSCMPWLKLATQKTLIVFMKYESEFWFFWIQKHSNHTKYKMRNAQHEIYFEGIFFFTQYNLYHCSSQNTWTSLCVQIINWYPPSRIELLKIHLKQYKEWNVSIEIWSIRVILYN